MLLSNSPIKQSPVLILCLPRIAFHREIPKYLIAQISTSFDPTKCLKAVRDKKEKEKRIACCTAILSQERIPV